MIKLKPITDKSWLVISENSIDKIGLLSNQNNKFVFLVNDAKTVFNNENEINDFFNKEVFKDIIETDDDKKVDNYIFGYPVDYDHPLEAENDTNLDVPVFAKTKSKKVLYGAGYYCVNYPTGWTSSFCPKLSTLEKRDYRGPFKTEREMKSVLSSLRRNERN